MKKTLLLNGSIVTETGLRKADILIGITGEVEEINSEIQNYTDADITDCTGKLLFPLLIDCHVHFREPGLEHKATMKTEGASALAGGIGTVCEMPNTIPPTVTIAALADKVRRSEELHGLMMKFFFGVTEAMHLSVLRELWTGTSGELLRLKRSCVGVKLYLDHSTGNQKVDGGIIEEIFRTCAELKIPLVAHCEDAEMNAAAKIAVETRGARVSIDDIALHSDMRPPASEEKSVREAIDMTRRTGAALHIAHLSTKGGLDLVRQAKAEGLPVTCEVAPHHLFLTTDDYAILGARGKMNPPLRTHEHQNALWEGIADGTVDCIATDHAPHTLEEKSVKNPLDAPSGVPGVQTMLPLLLTVAAGLWPSHSKLKAQSSQLTYADIVRLCFTKPNRIFSLGQQEIREGVIARIAIVDPTSAWTIEGRNLKSACGWTPYEGWQVTGGIVKVLHES